MERYRIKKPHTNHFTEEKTVSSILLRYSIILWFVSVLLVGFYTTAPSESYFFGWFILMLMPFAWLLVAGGWAVYANLFYWWYVVRLRSGKSPQVSIWLMIFFALQTFLLREVPRGTSGADDDVIAWGYGAFLWGFALILLAGTAWDKRKFRSHWHTIKPYLIVFASILAATFTLKYWQWQHANIYERKQYLHILAAFGVFKPSGVHYAHNPFPANLPHTDVPLEVDGEIVFSNWYPTVASIQVGEQNFKLPNVFLYQGHKITNTSHYFIVEKSDIQAKYRYRVENMGNEKARLSLYDVAQQKEIWHSEESLKKYERLFDAQIKTVFRQPEYTEPATQSLPPQAMFTETCPVAPSPNLTTYALRWDNKVSSFETTHYLTLFCQDNMVLVMKAGYSFESNHRYPEKIYLMQRDNIKYLGIFQLSEESKNQEFTQLFFKYKRDIVPHIQSIELNGQDLLMKHEFGTTLFHKKAD